MLRKLGNLVTAIALITMLNACAYYAPRYDEPDHRYDYYYYPNVGVYFSLYSGDYFYRRDNHWVSVRVLPRHIHVDPRIRRTLVVHDDAPYRKYEQHRERYRPRPDFKSDPVRDRLEREHNRRQHEEYRRRPEMERRPPR